MCTEMLQTAYLYFTRFEKKKSTFRAQFINISSISIGAYIVRTSKQLCCKHFFKIQTFFLPQYYLGISGNQMCSCLKRQRFFAGKDTLTCQILVQDQLIVQVSDFSEINKRVGPNKAVQEGFFLIYVGENQVLKEKSQKLINVQVLIRLCRQDFFSFMQVKIRF